MDVWTGRVEVSQTAKQMNEGLADCFGY